MNKVLIARYYNSSGQIEEWPPQLKTTPFQSKLFISFILIQRKRQQIMVTSFLPPRCMPLSRHERKTKTKTKGKKTERTLGINRGRTKTRTGDRHKVDTQNTGSERYTQKAKGRTSKHKRTTGQKKKDPGKEDRRVSEGKTETERGKHWPANARAPALPPSIPTPSTLPLWTTDQKRNTCEQTQTKKEKKRRTKTSREREDKPKQKKKVTK